MLEFTTRSYRELLLDDDGDNGEMIDRGGVGADEADEYDSTRMIQPTSGKNGDLRLSSSEDGGRAAADGGPAQEQQARRSWYQKLAVSYPSKRRESLVHASLITPLDTAVWEGPTWEM